MTTQPTPATPFLGQVLALRHNEQRAYTQTEPTHPTGPVYAVAILDTPDWPDNRTNSRRALICAQRQNNTWTWIHMSPETRETIGGELLAAGAQPGDWWYLEIS